MAVETASRRWCASSDGASPARGWGSAPSSSRPGAPRAAASAGASSRGRIRVRSPSAPDAAGSTGKRARPCARRRSSRAWRRASRSRARCSSSTPGAYGEALLPFARPSGGGQPFEMPNIKQQKKRVRIAAEERLENLRYRSTIKTLTKRLSTVAADGDKDAVASEHRALVKLIDRAVARGALHRNAGARKKSQAARAAAGETVDAA